MKTHERIQRDFFKEAVFIVGTINAVGPIVLLGL